MDYYKDAEREKKEARKGSPFGLLSLSMAIVDLGERYAYPMLRYGSLSPRLVLAKFIHSSLFTSSLSSHLSVSNLSSTQPLTMLYTSFSYIILAFMFIYIFWLLIYLNYCVVFVK